MRIFGNYLEIFVWLEPNHTTWQEDEYRSWKFWWIIIFVCNYFTILRTNCLASYMFPNTYCFSVLWREIIALMQSSMTCKWKSIFQLKALSRLASLPVATYIMYLFSVLIFFFLFPLLYYPPITCFAYYKCGHDKNRCLINSDAMNLRSVWHYQELAYEQVYDIGIILQSLSGHTEQFGDQPGISICLLSNKVTVKW